LPLLCTFILHTYSLDCVFFFFFFFFFFFAARGDALWPCISLHWRHQLPTSRFVGRCDALSCHLPTNSGTLFGGRRAAAATALNTCRTRYATTATHVVSRRADALYPPFARLPTFPLSRAGDHLFKRCRDAARQPSFLSDNNRHARPLGAVYRSPLAICFAPAANTPLFSALYPSFYATSPGISAEHGVPPLLCPGVWLPSCSPRHLMYYYMCLPCTRAHVWLGVGYLPPHLRCSVIVYSSTYTFWFRRLILPGLPQFHLTTVTYSSTTYPTVPLIAPEKFTVAWVTHTDHLPPR